MLVTAQSVLSDVTQALGVDLAHLSGSGRLGYGQQDALRCRHSALLDFGRPTRGPQAIDRAGLRRYAAIRSYGGVCNMTLSSEVRDSVRYAETGPPTSLERSFLLLHGLGGSLDFWCAVAPSLGEVDRTLAIDLPGFGRSGDPAGGLTLHNVAESIIDFCQSMNTKNCTIVAHSLGGFVGLKLAAMDPELFRRLILVDAAPVAATTILKEPARSLKNPGLTFTLAAQFLAGLVPLRKRGARLIASSKITRTLALWAFVARPARLDPEITATALSYTGGARTVIHALRQSRQVDILGLLDDVKIPIDIVRGEYDNMNTAADVDCARRHAYIQRELVIPGCRHWPPIEAPGKLIEFILAESEVGDDGSQPR
jgi:pimeloyl-ACP methyl ester carboxylesterase